jgi:FixJ family two-component response regulator
MKQNIVAVVEDDPSMLKSIERLLGAYGFATESFDSAEAFLANSGTTQAACIVIDIHLTGISGIELRRRLTASRLNFYVIFITAADDIQIYEEAAEAGCITCLHKPFSANLLINAIRKVPGYDRQYT